METTKIPNRRRQPTLIRFDDLEREKLALLAKHWGVTMAGAIRRLIRDAALEKERE